ncbi:hypothetical protein LENED_003017 [Lentinula edodes]|uniref:Uncharacterized protein n=1 Tax=Lentinula edodes TaxID=5353 RepID=A0A1Q3E2G5_LENED|nr:hypothetical protein LENED_003017 [Lentinula edodes]
MSRKDPFFLKRIVGAEITCIHGKYFQSVAERSHGADVQNDIKKSFIHYPSSPIRGTVYDSIQLITRSMYSKGVRRRPKAE